MQQRLSVLRTSQPVMSTQSAKAFIKLVQTVKPTGFWEVGNTIGAYSWLALQHSTTCQAILFEADAENYAAILKTIHSQQLHRAEAHNIVVSTASSRLACVDALAAGVGAVSTGTFSEREANILIARPHGYDATATVETLTLDVLLARGYASPDIIKIETDTAAKLVMDGARTVLEMCSPILIVKTNHQELVRYLEGLSYRSFQFDQDNLIFISVYF